MTHTSEWIGPNISLLELVTRLPAGLEATVAVPDQGRFTDALLQSAVPFLEFGRFDKYRIPALTRAIRRGMFALVYGNSAHGASRNALIAAKLNRVPFLYHLREMAPPGRSRSARFYGFADDAIAVSRATADSYLGRFKRTPRVIYNGVPLEQFALDRGVCRSEVASEFGIDEEAPVLIHVGNVYERKGQLTALGVLGEVLRTVPSCQLLMVGRLDRDPAYVDSVRATIGEQGLGDRVIVTGLRTDVGRLLSAADVFLHTALADPHPRAVIEAMAARLPVVALAVDGVSETVVDGETGFLVPRSCSDRELADPVARLLKNPEWCRELGKRGHDRAERLFSAERTARDVAGVILGLVAPQ